ncbi:MAG: TraR/DksA family transcriptional regulator [Nocardioides sp.]
MDFDPTAALTADRQAVQDRLRDLEHDHAGIVEANEAANSDDEHDPEGATIAFERSQVGAMVRQAREHLAEIDAALARVADGSYGTCASCGRPIGEARLEARPTARTCIACAERAQG